MYNTPKPMSEKIILATCTYFNIDEATLIGKDLRKDFVYKRQICYYLLKEDADMSFSAIGRRFNQFDHNSAFRGHDKMSAHVNIYTQVKHDVRSIRQITATLL